MSAISSTASHTRELNAGSSQQTNMAFEAGSSMLNVTTITERLIGRGSHFHVVGPNSSSPIPSAQPYQRLVESSSLTNNHHISSRPPHQSDGVAFVLRPSTVPKDQCGWLNEAVHLEWQKGRGAAWISGSPEIQYCKKNGSFQFRVMDLASPSPDPTASIITESGLAAALDTLEDAALEECVSRHITEGGDDRLHLTDQGVNKYYCPPRPLPDDVVIRGSCTCSSPTPDGFEAARRLLRSLWSGHVTFEDSMKDIRTKLSDILQISVPHEIILHPSGSDAELIPLAIATARANHLGCSGIVNIVAAAGEVGSGTAPAAAGRHFSEFTPCGGLVNNGEVLADFPASTEVVELKPRSADGRCIGTYDQLVLEAINSHEKKSGNPYFIVHAVDGSKTGLRLPSPELLSRLIDRLGGRLLIVLDACQCRSEPEELNWFLARGAAVLVTASKFYSAPGFCGAVIVPMDSVEVLDQNPPPHGLTDYLTKHEVPSSIRALYNFLPSGPKNVGLLLRWACGITEMEMFAAKGESVKVAMREWVYGVRNLVCKRSPVLDLIDVDCAECVGDETRSGGVNSVVSIKFLTRCGKAHIDAVKLRRVHRHLTIDASKLLPPFASEEERKIASLRCMVGQPVKLGCYGVLRLAVGAPMAREIVQPGRLQTALQQDAKILDKMMVLSKYFDEMSD